MNHPMFGGGVDVWIYHEVAGLRPPAAAAGTVRFGVEPVVMRRVGAAAAATKLAGNDVASAWRYSHANQALVYNCTVPVGFTGHVEFHIVLHVGEAGEDAKHPKLASVREGSALLWSSAAASKDGRREVAAAAGVGEAIVVGYNEVVRLPVGAGMYSFTADWL